MKQLSLSTIPNALHLIFIHLHLHRLLINTQILILGCNVG